MDVKEPRREFKLTEVEDFNALLRGDYLCISFGGVLATLWGRQGGL